MWGLPATVNVDLSRTGSTTGFTYVASSEAQQIALEAKDKDKEKGARVSGLVTPLPRTVQAHLDHATGESSSMTLEHAPSTTNPNAELYLRTPEGRIVKATLTGIPTFARVELNSQESAACRFNLETSEPFTAATLQTGLGALSEGGNLREGDSWLGIRAYDPQAIEVDFRARGVGGAHWCETPEGEPDFLVNVGGTPDFRIQYKNTRTDVEGTLKGVPGGTYTLKKTGDAFEYTGPGGLASLYLHGWFPWEDALFERDLKDFTLDARWLPSQLTLSAKEGPAGSEIRFDSNQGIGESMGLLRMDVNLLPHYPPRQPSEDDEPLAPFTFDSNLRAGRLQVRIGDKGVTPKPQWARHFVAYRNLTDRVELHLDVIGFDGAQMEVTNDGTTSHVDIQQFGVAQGGWFDAIIQRDEGTPMEAQLYPAPSDLQFEVELVGESFTKPAATFQLKPEDKVDLVAFGIRTTGIKGFYFEGYGLPADVTFSLESVIGAAFDTKAKVKDASGQNAFVSGFKIDYIVRDDLVLRMRVGQTTGFHAQGDLDGARNYTDKPRIINVIAPDTTALNIGLTAGAVGAVIAYDRIVAPTTQMMKQSWQKVVEKVEDTEGQIHSVTKRVWKAVRNGPTTVVNPTVKFIRDWESYPMPACAFTPEGCE